MIRHPVFCNSSIFRLRFFLLVTLIGLNSFPAYSQKTDLVRLKNSNELTGEVKRMDNGLLQFSVDDIHGRLQIKWEHVTRLTSNKQLDIELRNSTFYIGSLIESPQEGILRIRTQTDTFDIGILEVAFIRPIKERFWRNLDGSISTGLSFTKATDVLQYSFGGDVTYHTLKTLTELDLNTILTSKKEEAWKTNTDLDLTHYYFIKNRWYLRGGLGATRNDELGIKLRSSLSAGGGRRVIHSSRSQLFVSGLLSGNREIRNDDQNISNIETVLSVTFLAYRYDTPRLELRTSAETFLNLTTLGRVRLNLDLRLSLEIIKDLFWDISQAYFRFDSDPSLAASSRTDYGFVTNIRYRFGIGAWSNR